MKSANYGLLLKLATVVLKSYLLTLFGFALFCLLSCILDASHLAEQLMASAGEWLFWRLPGLTFCVMATTVVYESLRE